MLPFQTENGSQAIFLINPFAVCSSCKRKFVVCLFVYFETNGSCPFANGLNGITHLGYFLYIHFALQDRFFFSKRQPTRQSAKYYPRTVLPQSIYFRPSDHLIVAYSSGDRLHTS